MEGISQVLGKYFLGAPKFHVASLCKIRRKVRDAETARVGKRERYHPLEILVHVT